MSEVISKGAFAIRLGKMPSAVSNWIARGKLAGAALTADGRISVEEALRQLRLNVDPGIGRPSTGDLSTAAMPAAPPAAPEMSSSEPAGQQTLAQLRLARERLSLEAQERAAAIERGELVRAAEASRAWAAELEDLVIAVEQFVIDLPTKLGLGREAVDTARREWREFRRRRAEQASAVTDANEGAHAA